jgi:hypothetical protein
MGCEQRARLHCPVPTSRTVLVVVWCGLSACARIRKLQLESNRIEGSFPSVVSGLSSLE